MGVYDFRVKFVGFGDLVAVVAGLMVEIVGCGCEGSVCLEESVFNEFGFDLVLGSEFLKVEGAGACMVLDL